MHAVDNLADVADTCSRCSVHFHHVDMAAFHDCGAVLTLSTWFSRWPASPVGPDAVHAFGDDPGRGCFPGSPNPGHDESLRDPIRFKRVLERAHHRVLSNEVDKGLWPVFAGEDLIGGGV